MTTDHDAIVALKKLLSQPAPLEVAAKAVEQAGAWGRWSFERQLWYLRWRSRTTQAELAKRSGISQARISRLEAGADFKWSTLRALWAALGYEPLVLPDLPGRTREGRPRRNRRKMSPRP